jgi:hypothetical protein
MSAATVLDGVTGMESSLRAYADRNERTVGRAGNDTAGDRALTQHRRRLSRRTAIRRHQHLIHVAADGACLHPAIHPNDACLRRGSRRSWRTLQARRPRRARRPGIAFGSGRALRTGRTGGALGRGPATSGKTQTQENDGNKSSGGHQHPREAGKQKKERCLDDAGAWSPSRRH